MYQVCPVLPALLSWLLVPYSPLAMKPSTVGVAHCAHAGVVATTLSTTIRAILAEERRYMEILASSLAFATPEVEKDRHRSPKVKYLAWHISGNGHYANRAGHATLNLHQIRSEER